MKLIQTTDYLLLIDEEAEIKEGDTVYENISGVFAPYEKEDIVKNPIKIIAYYTLTKEAKELDLPELPPFEDKSMLSLLDKDIPSVFSSLIGHENEDYNEGHRNSWIKGYKAAQQSNKQFTLDDVKKAIEMAREYEFVMYGNGETEHKYSEEEIIQSLSTQQFPSEFIPEYEDVFNKTDSCSILDNNYHTHSKKLKTITNSEGKEVLVGTYKY